jgi:hypothetical protein
VPSPWLCETPNCPRNPQIHPADRVEVKVEGLRAGDHGRRFKSKIIHKFCRWCFEDWWTQHLGAKRNVAVQEESLF